VLGPRPTRVRREVLVDLPHPRVADLPTTPRFTAIERVLTEALHAR
jgi:hypothetical protein